MLKRLFRTPLAWGFVLVLAASAAFGLYWFQPWKLVTDSVVDEALPVVEAPAATGSGSQAGTPAPGSPDAGAPDADSSAPGSSDAGSSDAAAARGPQLVAAGEFVTHEHKTTGSTQLIRLPDGRHQLLLRDLNTSNGPDLRVWLTDQPVREGTAGWRVFDDGEWVELARLKGNRGDQVYEIPRAVDPTAFRSVSIWCRRFAVSFGAAELR